MSTNPHATVRSDQSLDPAAPHRHADFSGRAAVITGGTQGLGFATASLMKARGISRLLLVGRNVDKGTAAAASLNDDNCHVSFVSGDLATDEGTTAIVDAASNDLGEVHVFVNCAAATWRGTVWNTTASMWDDMLGVNVKAPSLLISAFAKMMKDQETGGTMVLVSSIAHHGAAPILYPYAASKHALEAVVKNAAFALMPHQIRVNMINPGWMDTPAEHQVQQRFHDAPDDWLVDAEARQPFGRLLKPEEVARGICFLASDESGMMTGASVDFDQTIPGVGDLPRAEPVPEYFSWQDQ